MTAYDIAMDASRTMQLIRALHLQQERDGNALVIDDRTLSAARVNQAAFVVLQALEQPRTRDELSAILADEADCAIVEAECHVVQLVEQLTGLGWIEFRDGVAGVTPASCH